MNCFLTLNKLILTVTIVFGVADFTNAQTGSVKGKVLSKGKAIEFATVGIPEKNLGTNTDSGGNFILKNIPEGKYKIRISCIGFVSYTQTINIKAGNTLLLNISLQENESRLNEVVITGTMKESFKSQSPVPVEVITAKYFLKNPSPSIFESMAMVNGVQPQLNCNVCNTGDIHINGMEGPYTMITIDGMPIVSSLSTVYGLSGIPNSMVQRVEVVKGPASTLYGSEAVGGLINIITKNPQISPRLAVDIFSTSNFEVSNDVAFKVNLGKATTMVGINYFNFKNKMDKNEDNFTDVTLQDRISIFNKWKIKRKESREASLAARYVYEDRWGGEMQWSSKFRGSDRIYGESIYTSRYELIGKYELPVKEKIGINFSITNHHQNSVYGTTKFMGKQNIAFVQFLWDKQLGKNNFLIGLPFRYTFYDDNTVGTQSISENKRKNEPQHTFLPGVFVQDEIKFSDQITTLIGSRFDYNSTHGGIFSPRLSIKYSIDDSHVFRLGGGNGYRVVNLFTEDHAALTGSREVIIEEALKPEQSYNINLNYNGFINHSLGITGLDISLFYTYFTNKIIGNFTTDPNKIIYTNLHGYAISKGISVNGDFQFMFPLKIIMGATLMDVYSIEKNNGKNIKTPQMHAPNVSGNFSVSYSIHKHGLTIDYTGKITGPMHLPSLTEPVKKDTEEITFRQLPKKSPWYSLQNIQVTKKFKENWELYGGVKNIFGFVPDHPIINPSEPFSDSFDTTYNYAPVLGARAFLGVRYTLK